MATAQQEPDSNAVAFAVHLSGAASAEPSLPAGTAADVPTPAAAMVADIDLATMLLEDPSGDRGIAGGPVDDMQEAAHQAFEEETSWLDELIV
jgi:hypothetical protein